MSARQFGRDSGDMYGRHALVNPGGDNRQIDVSLIVGSNGDHMRPGARIHSMTINDDYVGAHRIDHAPDAFYSTYAIADRAAR